MSAVLNLDEAYRRYQSGDIRAAEQLCLQLLKPQPPPAEAVYLLGVIAQDDGKLMRANELFNMAFTLAPDNAVFLNTLGESHLGLGKPNEALANFQQTITLRPNYERAHNNLGRLRHMVGDIAGAEASFREAVRLNPTYATALNNLGAVLKAKGDLEDATNCFARALVQKPNYPEAHFNLGTVLQTLGDPVNSAAHFQKAIELRPTYARAYLHLGQVLELLRQDHAALAAFQEAARLQPDDSPTQRQLGDLLMIKGDWHDALTALKHAHALQPEQPETFARLFYAKQMTCDWQDYEVGTARLWADAIKSLADGKVPAATPFQALTLPWSLAKQLTIANSHSDALVRHQRERGMKRHDHDPARLNRSRLRVGYLSGDFYDHPISHLLQGLFGNHDQTRFEVFAYSFGKADQSVYRQRIETECEHFVDVSTLSLPALSQRIVDDGIQILVDLMGYTGINRLGALALRPAPVQVNFLGNLGTVGGDFMDYIITDRILTPPEFAPYFVEKFVTMPHSYLIAEPEQLIPEGKIDRGHYGLPERGFVFCSFNSPYKLEPQMFSVWMRILSQVPDSVLWQFSNGAEMEANLRQAAQSHGVSPERLVFAHLMPRPEHILRHRAADLFLDSRLYNAAATASLALQMGLPVLVQLGDTFGSRVGASLLNTVGLSELIAPNLGRYEQIAVQLANSPAELERMRERLENQKIIESPPFDTVRFARNLERAYLSMWDIYAAGQPPQPIVVSENDRP